MAKLVRERPVIDDSEIHIPAWSTVCGLCRHRIDLPHRTCSAFPDGIPLRIWRGEIGHDRPVRGDHGIQFARVTAEDVETLEAIGRGERVPAGLSTAQLTERRRRVAS